MICSEPPKNKKNHAVNLAVAIIRVLAESRAVLRTMFHTFVVFLFLIAVGNLP